MHFPFGNYPVIASAERSRSTSEVGACYSDTNGTLLLFANSDTIYNAEAKPIVNGKLWFVDQTRTQGVLIISHPANKDSLYLFNLHDGFCSVGSSCLAYKAISIGNNSTSGPLPNTAELGYLGSQGNGYTEKLQAVKHADGRSWWVYLHDIDNADFYRYLVTANGIDVPQKQTIGSSHAFFSNNPYFSEGEMTFSQDGSKLLVAVPVGILDVFDVDRCTGELANWQALSQLVPVGPGNWYGCSFSPDGSKVYASEALPYTSSLYQWDLNAPNIAASKTLIYVDSTTNTYWGQHQLGPDGRIYITTASPDSSSPSNFCLGVINEPDSLGTACQFSRYGLYLQGLRTSFNLPNLPNYSLGSLFAQTAEAGPPSRLICPGSSVQLGVPDTSGGAVTFAWVGPHLNDSSAAQPLAKPDSTTWYYLTVTDTAYGAPCGVTMDSILIRVAGPSEIPFVSLENDTLLCPRDSLILGDASVAGWQYHWSGGGFILSPDSATTILSGAGAYALTVVNPLGTGACFTSLDSMQISEYQSPMPADPAGIDVLICNGDTAVLGATGTNWHYDWSSAVGGLSDMHTAQPLAWPSSSTMYTLHAHDTAFAGYCAQMSDTVIVTVEQPFTHASPEDVTFCPGECFTMGVPSASADYQYLWSPVTGLETPNQSLTKAQPTATMIYNLSIINPALQSAHCRERNFTVLAIADACNHQSFIAVNGDAIADRLDLGDHAGRVSLRVHDVAGRLVFADDDYQNDWSAAALAHGMYVYRVTVEGDCAGSFTGKIAILR